MNEAGFMQSPIDPEGEMTLSGSVESVIFANAENGYAICEFGVEPSDELVIITGVLPYVEKGDLLTVVGNYVHNPKYGRQFKVREFEKKLPADSASILRYLSRGNVKGIGPKTAQRIVDRFGEETFDIIENHPEWLTDIPGITHKRALSLSEDFQKKAGIRAAMLFFGEFFGAALTVRIYEKYKGAAVNIAKNTPYRLCEEIPGIGFEKADRMALGLGFAKDELPRLTNGILYVLTFNAQQNGHMFLPREKLEETATKLLEAPPEKIREAVERLLVERRLVSVRHKDGEDLYEKKAYESEHYVAEKLRLLAKLAPVVDTATARRLLQKEEAQSGMQYAEGQRIAITGALESGVMILTGGPGTGKTTVVRALLHILTDMDCRVALCAPTGRAAKRLSESTAHEVKTVHRLLEYGVEEGGFPKFRRNEQNLLEEDVIIVDEVSMVDGFLLADLCRAIKAGAKLILIGDADQLPSVGPGNVLSDLLESECFPSVRLTEIFRQARESLIVMNAHAINRGEMPLLDAKDRDFFFLPRTDDASIVATVRDLCKTRLPKTYGELATSGTQVLCPSRRGEAGAEHFNMVLQEALNPPSPDKREYRYREILFREGDRVMQTKNDYDIEWTRDDGSAGCGIFNGDVGEILRIEPKNERMEIRFDEKTVFYDFSLLDELVLSYAVTVHKSQGSEYPIVILPLGSTPPMLCYRNLLYTAVTRASTMVILVGREDVISTMIANHRQTMRYTGLCRFLREAIA